MSSSTPCEWRLPDSRKALPAKSASVVRSLYFSVRKKAMRVDSWSSSQSSLAPSSMLRLFSGGVLAFCGVVNW